MKSPERGEVWLVDLGLAAKVRPAVVLSVPADSPGSRSRYPTRRQCVPFPYSARHGSRAVRVDGSGSIAAHSERGFDAYHSAEGGWQTRDWVSRSRATVRPTDNVRFRRYPSTSAA